MDNQESVAFVGEITEVIPIKDADKIEQYKIGEYSVVGGKGFHKIGDKVGVAITNAVLPEEMIERLNIRSYLRKGSRVRTVRLKGVYSECLIFDIDANYRVGQDLMKDFNIIKYEEPVKNVGYSQPKVYFVWSKIHKIGMWKRWTNYQWNRLRKHYSYKSNPNFNVYHKFPSFKNSPNIFTNEDDVVITRKIHGSNFRCGIVKKSKLKFWDRNPYEFVYGSHRCEKGSDSQGYYSSDIWKEMVDKYDLKSKLQSFVKDFGDIGSGFILYGEVYGVGVQGKYDYNLKERELVCFDIEVNGEFLPDYNFREYCKMINIPIVPYLYEGKWGRGIQDRLVGGNIEGTNIPHEGIVVKSIYGDKRRRAKVVNLEYLTYSDKNDIPDEH